MSQTDFAFNDKNPKQKQQREKIKHMEEAYKCNKQHYVKIKIQKKLKTQMEL